MKLTILGSGTIIPDPQRNPSGLLLEHAQQQWALDLGPGNLQRLQAHAVSPPSLDGLLLSHFHLDHVGDLPHLLFGLRIPGNARTKPLVLHGPRGLKRLLEGYGELWGRWIEPRGYEIEIHEWEEGDQFFLGDLKVEVFEALHGGDKQHCLSYRIATPAGSIFAWSGDSDYSESLLRCCHNADLALLDCACSEENKVEGHMSPGLCGAVAANAGIEQTVLTHFYPRSFRLPEDSLLEPERRELHARYRAQFAEKAHKEPVLASDGMIFELV